MDDLSRLIERLRCERLAFRRLSDDSGVLVELRGGRMLSLNPAATFLVERIRAGVDTLDELARGLVEEFEVDEPTARQDIEACLEQLDADLSADSSD
jgi:hypothetical protein